MEREDLAWIEVKPEAMARYNDQIQAEIEKIDVWHGDCSDYYQAESGRIVTQWPRSMRALEQALRVSTSTAYEVDRRCLDARSSAERALLTVSTFSAPFGRSSRRSATNRAGCSMAAKWPPRGMTAQCVTL